MNRCTYTSKVSYKNILDIPTSIARIIIFFKGVLNVVVVRNFEVMLGQTLNHFV
jgi:hypothetical protein